MAKRKKPILRTLLSAMVFVVLSTAFLMMCHWKVVSMRSNTVALDEQIQELEQQIEDEKNQQLDEKVLQAYYESDTYKERIAREQFNLIYPGERLYILE